MGILTQTDLVLCLEALSMSKKDCFNFNGALLPNVFGRSIQCLSVSKFCRDSGKYKVGLQRLLEIAAQHANAWVFSTLWRDDGIESHETSGSIPTTARLICILFIRSFSAEIVQQGRQRFSKIFERTSSSQKKDSGLRSVRRTDGQFNPKYPSMN